MQTMRRFAIGAALQEQANTGGSAAVGIVATGDEGFEFGLQAFVDGLKLFRIGYSWAGPVSLAVPYALGGMRERPAWKGALVRFSLGLEAVADLQADLAQALATLD